MGMYWQIVRGDDERSAAALRRGLELDPDDVDILALEDALARLKAVNPRQEQVVVLRYFGGLTEAETAAILSPDKTVLLPEIEAGCPMADMITS